jgi:hypothetical protein
MLNNQMTDSKTDFYPKVTITTAFGFLHSDL